MTLPCLQAALDYRARGWSAIPLHGKKPALPSWKHCQTTPLSEGELRDLFRPEHNVGVVMGQVSGLVGLDIDSEAGLQLVRRWAGQETPPTCMFRTPHQGWRILFGLPAGLLLRPRSFRDSLGKEALRILGEGTQSVMPPSALDDGDYTWCRERALDQVPLAPCPDWLLEQVLKPEVPKRDDGQEEVLQRARRYLGGFEVRDPRPSHPMDASTHLLIAAGALVVGFDLRDDVAVSLLQEWDATNPAGPYPEKELRRKCEEARKHNCRPRGYLLRRNQRGQEARSEPVPVESIDAHSLVAQEFPDMRWAIPNLLPEGCVLLAGRPKSGKSWLVLQLAIAIAQGVPALKRLPTEGGEVLYVALEDGRRRLRDRLQTLLGAEPSWMPRRLHFATEWPRISEGCLDALYDWLGHHPGCRLVIFDTLTRIRDRRPGLGGGSLYEADYDLMALLKQVGDQMGLCVCAVHHTRKPKEHEEDPFDQISGTLGLGGAADAMIVLRRAVAAADAKLHITGRDVEEQSLTIAWDGDHCLWSLLDRAALTPDQAQVIAALRAAGQALTPLELYPRIGKNHDATRQLLCRMVRDGLVVRTRGKYSPLSVTVSQEDASHVERRTSDDGDRVTADVTACHSVTGGLRQTSIP
jgi:hypothetical protein